MKKKIAVAMGGYSNEAQISINSGSLVIKHLDKNHYTPFAVHITTNAWEVVMPDGEKYPIDKRDFSFIKDGVKTQFDAVFNIIHGTPGEDGLFAAYLQTVNIPQTSCDYYPAALSFNKRDCISVLNAYQIPTAKNYFYNDGDSIDEEEIIKKVGLPCFIKANKAGSSFGITKVKEKSEIESAINHALKQDDEVIIESYLSGTEVSVGVIQYQGEIIALPITEIVSENEFFDFKAKYLGESQEITPARIGDKDTQKVQELAIKVYKKLKLKGLSRAEFIFHQGEPHFIEVNTCPGLSEASILPQQIKAANLSLKEVFGACIERAISNR
ncbi:D-alanine--D-alanine ligase [Mesonia sp. HuA40]|uniref:D-alanine--D-alanine ligase n=1 Tax=Mesonia sp. HuA40 TaxID=2602761 RepID=UPI0011C9081C|nr:D-alanine--D-alanine ligase [Mesonia sp. HuA40]TXK71186.1 D-alanine--D-alanine ligase [Mesonia sp. HuA40]